MAINLEWQKLRKVSFAFFILLIFFCIGLYFSYKDRVSIEEFRLIIKNFGILAPVIFIAIFVFATIFIPSTPFLAIAGILFGFRFGFVYTLIGSFLSAMIVFLISRKLGKDWADDILQNKYMKKLDEYNKKLEQGAIYDLIIFRILPIMPLNVLNILMGISRIGIRDYIIGTIIGLIPSNIIGVYFGEILTKIF